MQRVFVVFQKSVRESRNFKGTVEERVLHCGLLGPCWHYLAQM